MRMFQICFLFMAVLHVSGCNAEPGWESKTNDLSESQIREQQKLLRQHEVLSRQERLIGSSMQEWEQLLKLANETASRGNESIHVFRTVKMGDDGSDGKLLIHIREGKIIDVRHEFVEN